MSITFSTLLKPVNIWLLTFVSRMETYPPGLLGLEFSAYQYLRHICPFNKRLVVLWQGDDLFYELTAR